MSDTELSYELDILRLTTDIVASFVSKNTISSADLPGLIRSVHQSLNGVTAPHAEEIKQPEPLKPAVPIKKSVTDDYIICLEDGKKLKMLKRYLRTNYDLSPEEYRARWNLPTDYPMVAPNYANMRSSFAKQIGLGKVQGKKAPRKTTRATKK